MKSVILALATAALSLPALAAPTLPVAGPAVIQPTDLDSLPARKSGRCPSGESRPYKPGCGGV